MGKKQPIDEVELTDTISDKGIRHFKKGHVLRFDYEGSITTFVVTRKELKPVPRIWAREVTLSSFDNGMSHYGHLVDLTSHPPYCTDCEVDLTQPATEEGDTKAYLRERDEPDEKVAINK